MVVLNKYRNYAKYDLEEEKIVYKQERDFIKFNRDTKECNIYLGRINETEGMTSFHTEDTNVYEESYNTLNIMNINLLEDFFRYFESIKYSGLDKTFEFFSCIDQYVSDLDSLQKETFLRFVYENYNIAKSIAISQQANIRDNFNSNVIADKFINFLKT